MALSLPSFSFFFLIAVLVIPAHALLTSACPCYAALDDDKAEEKQIVNHQVGNLGTPNLCCAYFYPHKKAAQTGGGLGGRLTV